MAPVDPPLVASTGNPPNAPDPANAPGQVVLHPQPHDILLGRGVPLAKHQGNVRFRELIRTRKDAYTSTGRQHRKQQIASEVLQEIRSRGCRFLSQIATEADARKFGLPPGTKAWYIADEDVVVTKVKQALREMGAAAAKSEDANEPEPEEAVAVAAAGEATGGGEPVLTTAATSAMEASVTSPVAAATRREQVGSTVAAFAGAVASAPLQAQGQHQQQAHPSGGGDGTIGHFGSSRNVGFALAQHPAQLPVALQLQQQHQPQAQHQPNAQPFAGSSALSTPPAAAPFASLLQQQLQQQQRQAPLASLLQQQLQQQQQQQQQPFVAASLSSPPPNASSYAFVPPNQPHPSFIPSTPTIALPQWHAQSLIGQPTLSSTPTTFTAPQPPPPVPTLHQAILAANLQPPQQQLPHQVPNAFTLSQPLPLQVAHTPLLNAHLLQPSLLPTQPLQPPTTSALTLSMGLNPSLLANNGQDSHLFGYGLAQQSWQQQQQQQRNTAQLEHIVAAQQQQQQLQAWPQQQVPQIVLRQQQQQPLSQLVLQQQPSPLLVLHQQQPLLQPQLQQPLHQPLQYPPQTLLQQVQQQSQQQAQALLSSQLAAAEASNSTRQAWLTLLRDSQEANSTNEASSAGHATERANESAVQATTHNVAAHGGPNPSTDRGHDLEMADAGTATTTARLPHAAQDTAATSGNPSLAASPLAGTAGRRRRTRDSSTRDGRKPRARPSDSAPSNAPRGAATERAASESSAAFESSPTSSTSSSSHDEASRKRRRR